MGRRWTVFEISYLLENAGVESLGDISRHLGRSPRAVEEMAYRLREAGTDVPGLKVADYESMTEICPSCGRWYVARKRIVCGRHGCTTLYRWVYESFCESCRLARQEAAALDDIAYWEGFMPPDRRDSANRRDVLTGSDLGIPDMPPEPQPRRGWSRAQRAKAVDDYRAECEKAAAQPALRRKKAARKRAERVHAAAVARFPELAGTKARDRMPEGWEPSQEAARPS